MISRQHQLVPEKWKKYILLATFGFTTEEELQSSIVRVRWKDRHTLITKISSILTVSGPAALIVVKLVPQNIGRQLPNFRVRQKGDLKELGSFLNRHHDFRFVEAWYCQTDVDSAVFSVAGRIRIAEGTHVLEQVWRCSPRMIEDWGDGFQWPFARATRSGWGRRWRLAELYVPEQSFSPRFDQRLEFEHSLRLLEAHRERLEEFSDAIENCGITTYSFEYKIVRERLTIIDWDTTNDRKVLDAYT